MSAKAAKDPAGKAPSRGKESNAKEPKAKGAKSAPVVESVPAPPRAWLAAVAAWLVPGAGHLVLGRWGRAIVFASVIAVALTTGFLLEGKLPLVLSGSPLAILATLGAMGSGIPYFLLRVGLDFGGSPASAGYEYGGAFLLTAGLMNILLVLDAWDIGRGVKE